MSESTKTLPVPVLDNPHWRVRYRPRSFIAERVKTREELLRLVEVHAVSLRGWDFPHLGESNRILKFRDSSIESWCEFLSHIEYWRFYQSGQFLYLGAVREAVELEWRAQLMKHAQWFFGVAKIDSSQVSHCLSVTNVVYTLCEHFEFAARLCQAGVYENGLELTISLRNATGVALTSEHGRSWFNRGEYDDIERSWVIESGELVSQTQELALAAAAWFFERLGWSDVSPDALRATQLELYKREQIRHG